MTEKELLEILDSWENIKITIRKIGEHQEYFQLLINVALYNKKQKSWRAAYLVDKIHDNFPELLIPYLSEITEKLKTENNTSKKRHFLKLISMNIIPEKHQGFLVDYCINALKSEKEPPAVRVHAMQILYNISEYEPELKPEILAVIEHEIKYHSTAGIVARGSKLVKKLIHQIE